MNIAIYLIRSAPIAFDICAIGDWDEGEPKASDVITLVKKTFVRTSISRGVQMRISAREACVKPHLRTLSDIKI